tara:strand:- start:179 stop:466 length:288 start_codon:yes stop_codon:yes gene_type:complete
LGKIEDQEARIRWLEEEVKALKMASKYITSGIRAKSSNLKEMVGCLSRMKADSRIKQRHDKYVDRVKHMESNIRKRHEKTTKQKLQEELNKMELK